MFKVQRSSSNINVFLGLDLVHPSSGNNKTTRRFIIFMIKHVILGSGYIVLFKALKFTKPYKQNDDIIVRSLKEH